MAAWNPAPARSSCTDCGSWRWVTGQGEGSRALLSSELGMSVSSCGQTFPSAPLARLEQG